MVAFYFFDTSAIVKRYTQEQGSSWVLQTVSHQPNRIILSRITWVEVLSALSRLRREREISAAQLSREIHAFKQHFKSDYHVAEFNRTVASLAGELVQRQPLRAYDAVQLASALRLREIYHLAENVDFTFVTADQRLINVAVSEGISVINPVEQE